MPFRTVSNQKEYIERLTLLKASVNFNLEIFHRPISRHAHLVPIGLNPHLHILTLVRVYAANLFEIFQGSCCIKTPFAARLSEYVTSPGSDM